jgi:hypothetical protein
MHKSEKEGWHGVPLEKVEQWRAIFNNAREGMSLAEQCPVCGARSLKQYYHLVHKEPKVLRSNEFRGRGSCWEWCSSCRSYEHMDGLVPVWWHEEPLDVDHFKLTPIPDMLDEAILRKSQRGNEHKVSYK